jgi:hypothetical protein
MYSVVFCGWLVVWGCFISLALNHSRPWGSSRRPLALAASNSLPSREPTRSRRMSSVKQRHYAGARCEKACGSCPRMGWLVCATAALVQLGQRHLLRMFLASIVDTAIGSKTARVDVLLLLLLLPWATLWKW